MDLKGCFSNLGVWTAQLLFYFLITLPDGLLGKKLPLVYWNSTNPIFRIDNTDHVISAKIRDRLDIICPYYDLKGSTNPGEVEYSEVYQVPKWHYENCRLPVERKIVGVCSSPYERQIITVVFREFTPKPGGLEFVPGEEYFFLSTSNGSLSGLSNSQDGLCKSSNMKLKIEIVPDEDILLPFEESQEIIEPRWPGGASSSSGKGSESNTYPSQPHPQRHGHGWQPRPDSHDNRGQNGGQTTYTFVPVDYQDEQRSQTGRKEKGDGQLYMITDEYWPDERHQQQKSSSSSTVLRPVMVHFCWAVFTLFGAKCLF